MKQPVKVYLAMLEKGHSTGDLCSMAWMLFLREELLRCGVMVQLGSVPVAEEHDLLVQACRTYAPDAALFVSAVVDADVLAVYHQVTEDWNRYGLSCRLAEQVVYHSRRYRPLHNRSIQAGYPFHWLCSLDVPAVYLQLGVKSSMLQNLPQMAAQAKACARALLELLQIPYQQVQYPTLLRENHKTDSVDGWMELAER